VLQPNPTVDQLRNAPRWQPGTQNDVAQQYLDLPTLPPSVIQLATRLTQGLAPYDQARAVTDYFTNAKNGFKYSLQAPADDGRAALVTFLDKKTGFCQQYAATAAVLMRQAGLPTRVVLGYTHQAPDASGSFTVTTGDAHAWVETYFDTVGWVAFDPTPLGGADAGRTVLLPWAPNPTVDSSAGNEPSDRASARPTSSESQVNGQTAAPKAATHSNAVRLLRAPVVVATAIVVALLALLIGPRLLRRRQRRRRLAIARTTGNPELLWLELAASAADRDVLWPATTTVGQVPEWLAMRGVDEPGTAAVSAIAHMVERDRFSAQRVEELPADFLASFNGALSRWARRADRRGRLLDRWLPRSLLAHRSGWRR
jgi:hypothetical protein